MVVLFLLMLLLHQDSAVFVSATKTDAIATVLTEQSVQPRPVVLRLIYLVLMEPTFSQAGTFISLAPTTYTVL